MITILASTMLHSLQIQKAHTAQSIASSNGKGFFFKLDVVKTILRQIATGRNGIDIGFELIFPTHTWPIDKFQVLIVFSHIPKPCSNFPFKFLHDQPSQELKEIITCIF
jgi:hypothetical protein